MTDFYNNHFGFALENISAVKNALRLSSSEKGTLFGKTGTGIVNELHVNGWFIGYVETAENTYFFASVIHAGAAGSDAAEITLAILSDMGIYP